MRAHLSNAAFGVLDYLAYPFGMLLLAPLILHAFGIERYGIWALANAILNTGAILASGFADANTRSVAMSIAPNDHERRLDAVQSSLAINLGLGLFIELIVWLVAPLIAHRSVPTDAALSNECCWSIRIAALLILTRALETVCVSTQRAFSRYGRAIQFSLVARLFSIAVAVVVPRWMPSVTMVMLITLMIGVISLGFQFQGVCKLLKVRAISPRLQLTVTRELLGFGGHTWLQSAAGLLFGQADRIYAGIALGAVSVTPYVFCAQLTQPIYGIAAAAFHFMFPLVASQVENGGKARANRTILLAVAMNVGFAAIALSLTLFLGRQFLIHWAGPTVAKAAVPLLPIMAWSSALPALSVAGTYALLAIGSPRWVTYFTLVGGVAMIAALPFLTRNFGMFGIASARLLYGFAILGVYIPLIFALRHRRAGAAEAGMLPICEEI